MSRLLLSLFLIALPAPALAETGYEAWLRYDSADDQAVRARYAVLPACVVALDDSVVIQAAQQELIRGVRGMLGRTLRVETDTRRESAIILGTIDAVIREF